MPGYFTSENAREFAKRGGEAKRGKGFKQRAEEWVKENGFDKAISWVDGPSDRRATFAMGLLFSYALGRPAEILQIEDKKEVLIRLVSDPTLNELATRFGAVAARVREIGNGSVVDGEVTVQTEGSPI